MFPVPPTSVASPKVAGQEAEPEPSPGSRPLPTHVGSTAGPLLGGSRARRCRPCGGLRRGSERDRRLLCCEASVFPAPVVFNLITCNEASSQPLVHTCNYGGNEVRLPENPRGPGPWGGETCSARPPTARHRNIPRN